MSTISLLSAFQSSQQHQLNPLEAAKGFASDIVKRTGIAGQDKDRPEQEPELGNLLDHRAAAMEKSLENTIHYLVQNHGKSAASAAMGIIYKSIGDSQVTETNLGNALLDVTRFIDANFGFASGDEFIHHLNDDLNASLNDLFQNGKNELFIATTTVNGETVSTLSGDSSHIIRQSVSQTVTDNLNELNAITDEILNTLRENRIAPDKGTPAAAYAHLDTPLPTGVMIDSAI